MKKIILLLIIAINFTAVFAQNNFKAVLKDNKTNELLIGVNAQIQNSTLGGMTDGNGVLEIAKIPNGEQSFIFTAVGYEDKIIQFTFPLDSTETPTILLESKGEDLDDVVITTTRSSRTIANTPTRVETIAGEELDEKGNMKPGDIRMLLNESTGIQTQQTSATSYNSSIRIQGLDGKYTQIIRDGFPLYSGFSGGLGLMQIAPLDLKQVEVIKGASSTLYGGGAIAGLVNLVSKTPTDKRELNFILNGTSALGLDASGFYSQKFKKIGTTIFASYNHGTPYDPANIGLTAIPKFNRFTLNPKLYLYLNEKTNLHVGFNSTIENRIGGDIEYIKGNGDANHSYFEKNKTNRFSTQLAFDRIINKQSKFSFKNSFSFYDRSIVIPNYSFSGKQFSSFVEANYNHNTKETEWIGGLNLWTDQFTQDKIEATKAVDYKYTTVGAFVQNTWNPNEKIAFETGLRMDYQNKYGVFLLPRLSALYTISPKLSARLGGGLGYKTPTVFTEDAERIQFRNVLPVETANTKAEKSIGGNFDLNYKTYLTDQLALTINSLFFYTRVNNPLVLTAISDKNYEFKQPKGNIDTKGIETNIKLSYQDFKLFIGYTLADVNEHYNGITTTYPLVAKHRLNNVLMYEIEEKLKIGLEAYYFSPQKLNDGATGRQYWLGGFMIEKLWENFSIFLNFENLGDTRQTKFDTIYTGPITNPTFRDIYAPVDGFVVNGGVKIKL
ncbi:TonB-dependent receptor [Flavobacterium sp. 7A]|uniref:TonB-dependent receptor n=1 Tax=Flavobacterium sp. 7A TaxID=2940571 RepID=UPI0022274268|nr:TonB-dependent receptor [Flavobacterium sp. 7A]MCW2119520.1 iron complex outermembrane receptor protein [Flavobacterium sp. 7A]